MIWTHFFSSHSPYRMKIFKGLWFLSLDLLLGFGPVPHICNAFPVFCHDMFLLLCVTLQLESPAGSAGGLCFLSSEVHWPAESLRFPANLRKSKVFFALFWKVASSTKKQNTHESFKFVSFLQVAWNLLCVLLAFSLCRFAGFSCSCRASPQRWMDPATSVWWRQTPSNTSTICP